MFKKFTPQLITLFIVSFLAINISIAQNSLLVNFGTSSCTASSEPVFSFIKNPLTDSSSVLNTCSLAKQLTDIYGVFIAYNPKNNKIYVADIKSGVTKIWLLDMGLPANISCPSLLDSIPDYSYSYASNNFEFDNNGDLWSFSNYNDTTGQCHLDKFDVSTGTVINTRLVQFPAGNFPTTISSGDFTILPNGRMFATLGSSPSRLYEITNYNSSTGATAIYLNTLPQNCFGIAYLNGQLEVTGSNFAGNCYYYKYNIAANILDSSQSFQNGQLPIDNTSLTPSLGVTKQLLNATKVNDNTADLTYEIYVRNLGNVSLKNINATDNLAAVFGATNISGLSVEFVPGANQAGLVLNPLYNGSTENNLLVAGQNLANQTSVNTDYFLKLHISFRVTNVNMAKTYLNSAIGSATIGSTGTLSFINVSDSSNNGTQNAVDPNNNGNAGEAGENVPTPFTLSSLPVHFISINAFIADKTSSLIKWSVATPTINSDRFEIEFSTDGRNWNTIGTVNIENILQGNYSFTHNNIPSGNLYYRIEEIDDDGQYIYSNIALLNNKVNSGNFVVFPNPASNHITISTPYNTAGKASVNIYDAAGRQLFSSIIVTQREEINTSNLPDGTYILKINSDEIIITQKVLIMHR